MDGLQARQELDRLVSKRLWQAKALKAVTHRADLV
ncbi:gas vesicle protein GvpC [uncultured Pseudomonas sp.]